ncbi:MAG: cephalosporin hydroxylase family protein [Acidobacteriia bacterium]|nr:cephalosporin hydroxylase family protein [Terriglobia bacterium]
MPVPRAAARAVIAVSCLAAICSGCRRHRDRQPAVSEIHLSDEAHKDRILRGVYAGEGGWMWTAPSFAVALDPPPPSRGEFLEMDFAVPEELLGQASTVTLVAHINGVEVARQTYSKAGRYLLSCRVPAAALARRPAEVVFTADRSFVNPAGRVLGLIAVSVALKEYEQSAQFRDEQLAQSRQAYAQVLKQRDLQMPLDKQREMMKLFHDLPIWNSLWFHNVRIIKNPLDLWMLQQIAYEVRPDFVIETGTWYGGSALYWAHTLNGMGLESARVLTVDIQDLTGQGASAHPLWKKYVEFYLGSSTDPAIVSQIARKVRNWRTIVNLDSDHSMQHVLRELRLYAPLVSPGSYIAVEDTHLDGVPTHPEQGPGPMAAVRQFLAEGGSREFEQDFTREAMVMTSYPGGWLRRKSKP